ncbi:MAG: nitroreductase family protein [Nocardioides sp.]|nr:nitroreductase family protein [Nocardioides sp.]
MVTWAAVEATGAAPRRGVTRSIVAMAMRAPSLHNTQPWRWRIASEHTLELYADHDRQLHGVDPRARLMTLSLGCALHHAVVAARSVDRAVLVERFPDGPPDLVARLHLEGRSPAGPADRVALASLVARRTDRRPFSSWEVPTATLDRLAEVSAEAGAPAVVLDVRQRVAVEHLVSTASLVQSSRRLVEREHSRWWAVEPRATYDGVPAELVPDRVVDPLGRGRDGAGTLDGTPAEDAEAVAERAAVLAICHDDDTREGWLAAGEALSAVWLEAVGEGLGGVPVSLPVEEPEVREQLRSGVLGLAVQPQVLLRLGWPHTSSARLPGAPRRPIDDVLVP